MMFHQLMSTLCAENLIIILSFSSLFLYRGQMDLSSILRREREVLIQVKASQVTLAN